MKLALSALAAAALAGAAWGQQELVTYTISLTDSGGNNNGIVEPGESALFTVNISFAPPVGTPIPGAGTVAGLSSIAFDLTADCEHTGTWCVDGFCGGRAPGWELGSPGTPQPNGDLLECHAGQFVLPGLPPNSQNPVNAIWRGTWTPASFASRGTTTFSLRPAQSAGASHSALLIHYADDPQGQPLYNSRFVPGQFGSVQLVQWGPPPLPCGCYANCDGSVTPPFLNVNDFICFQGRFAAGDSYANCDGSAAPPILNVNDFVCFMQKFAAGCF
jgi:hypothetical protein